MFAATRRWFRRNRTPIAITLGVVGAGYVVTQYVLSKLNDARERMSSERIAKENLRRRFEQNQEDCTFTVLALLPTATTNILEAMNTEKITYEIQQMKAGGAKSSATKAGSSGAGSTSPPSIPETNLTDEDGRSMISMQSESGVHASQVALPSPGATDGEQARPRKTKRQLWDDLTISSITRAYTLIYTLGLLTMLTRIQLNLLGRRSYLSSVVSLATGPGQETISLENKDDDASSIQAYGDDFETNRRYLTFSWWLLNRGWIDIAQRVEAAVREVFGHLSPRDQLTFETFAALTSRVRRAVEGGDPQTQKPLTNWLPYLLPPVDLEDHVLRESGVLEDSAASLTQSAPPAPLSPTSATSLRRLLDETSDLAESPPFSHVLTLLLDAGFSHLLDRKVAFEAYELPPPPPADAETGSGPSGSPELQRLRSNKQVLLPRILSVLAKQAHAIGNGMPNEYLQAMEQVRDLEAFAAVVYSSNWESEIRDDGPLGAAAADAGKAEAGGSGGSSVRQSQASGGPVGEESLVLVDPEVSFESAWERATEKK
ncbi:Peroxisomal biogenesis factor 3 [Pleurostoma richardsiae]|uniref:Peroxisomal biogenesis factor 3 n=1 Tax=Pleurostoma richardsiae TaxID=41990 RepID=A0AA38RLN7_9PEZI|nr:Peroxisomal biogenesis factor 3 [Pleurostoma richardsiae]